MAKDDKRKEPQAGSRRRAAGYQSARKPKLRRPAAPQPPPLPALAGGEGRPGGFGEASEDGLRLLAALETMPSLEPDFCDDLAAEASVTIVERAVANTGKAPAKAAERTSAGSLRARLDELGTAPDIDAKEHAAYIGPVEEAVVEIVEAGHAPQLERRPAPPRRHKQATVAHRFLKALTGGGG